jgi:hypothetical protein
MVLPCVADGEAPKAGKSSIGFAESDSDFVTDAPTLPERFRDAEGEVFAAPFADDLRLAVGWFWRIFVKLETKL